MAASYSRQGTGALVNATTSPSKRLLGFLLAESGGVNSVVTLYDNAAAASGNKLAVAVVEANKNAWIPLYDISGANFSNGIYVDVSAGTVDVTVYV